MRDNTFATLFTFGWLALWFTAVIFAGEYVNIQLKDIKFNEVGDFLAGVFAPIALVWFYMGYTQQGDELKQAVDEYKNMVKIQYMKYRPRFEPVQIPSITFGNSSTDGSIPTYSYTLELKNTGQDIYNISFPIPAESHITHIYNFSRLQNLAHGMTIGLDLFFNERNEPFRQGVNNLMLDNTLFTIKYDTVVEENITETFQVVVDNYTGNFEVSILKL